MNLLYRGVPAQDLKPGDVVRNLGTIRCIRPSDTFPDTSVVLHFTDRSDTATRVKDAEQPVLQPAVEAPRSADTMAAEDVRIGCIWRYEDGTFDTVREVHPDGDAVRIRVGGEEWHNAPVGEPVPAQRLSLVIMPVHEVPAGTFLRIGLTSYRVIRNSWDTLELLGPRSRGSRLWTLVPDGGGDIEVYK